MSISRLLRIIAIPLTRPKVSRTLPHFKAKPSRRVYYQFQIALDPPPSINSIRQASGDQVSDLTNANANAKRSALDAAKWVTKKAAYTWIWFGKGKSGWKTKLAGWMLDRLDFEKLDLMDLPLSPSVVNFISKSPVSESEKDPLSISLLFPSSLLSSSEVLSELRGFVAHRLPKHTKGFYFWLLSAPLTVLFLDMFNVFIPNLPFFYCVWRVWTHDRAYKSLQYLQFLLDHDLLVPEACESLNEVYKLYPPTISPSSNPSLISESEFELESSSSSMPKTNPKRESQHTLLAPEAVPAIVSLFGLESTTASADLHRAIEHTRLKVASGRDDL